MNAFSLEACFPVGLRQLLQMRTVAKMARLKRRIFAPRRIVLTAIALLLAAFWAGQTLLGILLRPAADPQRLQLWITSGLVMYAYWHLLRTAWNSERVGIPWSRPERELLWTAPLSRAQLIGYRLAGSFAPACLKAALLTVVLLPDSSRIELTFLGLLMALGILELSRMIVEIGCSGMSKPALLRLRIGVAAIAMAIAASVGVSVWTHWNPEFGMPAIQLPNLMLGGLVELSQGEVARTMGYPMRYLADIAIASHWNLAVVIGLIAGTLEIAALVAIIFWVERALAASQLRQHRVEYASLESQQVVEAPLAQQNLEAFQRRRRLSGALSFAGVGPLVARHAVTLRGYWLTVLATLFVPAAFSTFPIWVVPADQPILIHVVGSLIFYTLLLGPPALKIDFRRDLDRILSLRQLPISEFRITIGQLALPIAACLAFQLVVLAVTAITRTPDATKLGMSILVLIPATVFTFALENAIFLTFPQRTGQEGIEVLIRTTLVFTFKGLLFVLGVAVLMAWTMSIRRWVSDDYQSIVYRTGGLAILWSAAAASLWATATALRRFDLSVDTPAA
ncbi:hypothetical protein Poly24_12130 [Rosistilla carotiformis]|uniref:Uncharacterized protein n=1 Tax=Rosistilla carotiformis TaxID=2528017 RepID=A0A518JPQ2_9BACT|nr:hypothetical protein [Rosistilla carotiformis]QDV67513.1 hypothetical protein Poly24_12130 [Rosistilla carotiformis]